MFGKTQPIRTKFGIRGHVKGWQRNFGRDRRILGKMGAGTSPAERELFCVVNQATFPATSQRPIFTKFGHDTWIYVPSLILKRRFRKFSFRGHLPSQKYSKLTVNIRWPASLQNNGRIAETLFTPRCCLRPKQFQRSVIFVRPMVLELRSVQVRKFFSFLPFSPYKSRKKYFFVLIIGLQGYIAVIPFILRYVQKPQGCLLLVVIFCDVWWGSWGPKII